MTVKIGEKIKKVLSDAGLSQTDLAKCLGVSPQQVSHWINDKGFPSLDKFIALVQVAGKDANYFFGLPSCSGNNHIVGDNNHNIHQTINTYADIKALKKDVALIKQAILDLQRKKR